MSGYTPVFDTVFEGSLCGRYPDTAAWMFFLALADWKGEVDKTPEFIATITGMPLAELRSCIERFMQPDLRSRSQAEEGRKLVAIDPHRDWGWRVVNIAFYRKKASGQNQIEDGRNADKVKRYRDRHRATPRDTPEHSETPPDTAEHRVTRTHTHTHTKNQSKRGAPKSRRVPEDFLPDREHALASIPDIDVDREIQKFRDWEFKTPRSDWPAVWRTWIGNCRESGKYAKREVAQWR